jgi:hypothetical protein
MYGTTFDTATTSLCAKLITHSENEVNKYISKRYDIGSFNTTSTAIPPLVTSLAETLTEGYMYHRMSRGGKEWMTRAKDLIKQATDNLQLISDYKMDLVDSSGDRINDLSTGSYQLLSTTTKYSNTFNEDDSLNWEVDTDKLDDISSERE